MPAIAPKPDPLGLSRPRPLSGGIAVIKMGGSQHGTKVHEFTIGGRGMHVGEPCRNVENIILGVPSPSRPSESEQLAGMFGNAD